jgi:hypothetical protein
MSQPTLYEDDIVLWSEQQAEIIRELGRTRRDLPNALDVENVAEEIESVGRSEMASVESFVRLLMLHLIKIVSVPHSPAALHWRDEARNFAADASMRFAPSMAQRIDLERIWRLAKSQALSSLSEHGDAALPLPRNCPWVIEELVQEPTDLDRLLSRLQAADFADQPDGP